MRFLIQNKSLRILQQSNFNLTSILMMSIDTRRFFDFSIFMNFCSTTSFEYDVRINVIMFD